MIVNQIDVLSGFQSLSKGGVSVIITSPPYNIGIPYANSYDRCKGYLSWLSEIASECSRVLKRDGHFFLQAGGIAQNPSLPWKILDIALEHFKLQNEIVWAKNISIGEDSYGQFKPINSNRFLTNTHEYIFHLTKTGDVSIDRLAVGVPLKYKCNLKRFNHQVDARCRGNTWFIPYETIQKRREHPATFPDALPEMCIKLSGVPKGSIILDPFLGSGSTLVAAKKLGMKGIGFDISHQYCDLARKRIEETKEL